MKIAVVSSSMNPASRSRRLAAAVASDFGGSNGVEVDFVDLQENVLPLCDGGETYGHPSVQAITERLGGADAFVIATPIYNYAVNSALKNLTEYAGDQMSGKLVGFFVFGWRGDELYGPDAVCEQLDARLPGYHPASVCVRQRQGLDGRHPLSQGAGASRAVREGLPQPGWEAG